MATLIEVTDPHTENSSTVAGTLEDFTRAVETETACYVGPDATFIRMHLFNALEYLARGAARYTFQLGAVVYSISPYSGRGRHAAA